jgi:hypothetical protein
MSLNQLLKLRVEIFQRERAAREWIERAATPEDLRAAQRALRQVQKDRAELNRPATTCGARTRAGHPCAKWPVAGSRRCELHGGKTPRGFASVHFRHGQRMRRPRLTEEQLKRLAEAITRANETKTREDVAAFRRLWAEYYGCPPP